MLKKLLWVPLALALTAPGFGQSLSARLSTSFYSWERSTSDSISENHLRVYQTARITVGQLASNRLSFHFYGQASQDIAQKADDDLIPRLYNTYAQWRERKGVLRRVRLGRQRIYSGVAYGTIDGLDIQLQAGKYLKVGGFVGTLVPFVNKVKIADWDAGHSFGMRVSTDKLFGSKILLSFVQRNRRPVAYSQPGRYTNRVVSFESLEQRLAGLDIFRSFSSKFSTYGRLDFDIEQQRVRRGQVELRLSVSKKIDLTGEFVHRAPLLEANSLFSVFTQNTSQHVGLRASYNIKQSWFVNGNLGLQKYEGDKTIRFGAGIRYKHGFLGYNYRSGYGGLNNGLHVAFNYPLTQKLSLLASSGFSRYSLFDEKSDKNTSLTGSVGFNYRQGKHLSIDFMGHGVRNRFLRNDFRLFIKANYWFFKSGR